MFILKVTSRGIPVSDTENGPIIGYDMISVFAEVVQTREEVDSMVEIYAEDPEGIKSVEVWEVDSITVRGQVPTIQANHGDRRCDHAEAGGRICYLADGHDGPHAFVWG